MPISRRYEPGTLIIETTWVTETGWLVVADALTIGQWEHQEGPGTRPQIEHEPDGSLLRLVTCIDGNAEVEMECAPCFGYGSEAAAWSGGELGGASVDGDGIHLELTSDMDLTLGDNAVRGRIALSEDDVAFCAVSWGENDLGGPRSAPEAVERLESTREFWRHWLRHGSFPDHPWRVHLQRSALVLKGLTYAPTGAIVAAPTTSLPETPGGERNWDYRYAWIRDSTFSLWALHTLGFDEEAALFMRFVRECAHASNDRLQIMYGVGHETDLTERTLDHLSGYDGARPVRVGNGAFRQRQHDVWGAMLDSIYLHRKALQDLVTDEERELVVRLVETAIEAWPHPDQGIWEGRGEPRHYVSSKLMIWVAVDRGARLAYIAGGKRRGRQWEETAHGMREEILERGVREGVFRQHYDTDALDASTLLVPLLRFLPPGDRRVRATVYAIAEELTRDGLVLRYRVGETDDGLRGEEGTFLICSFWLASALSEIGERDRARALCERLLGLAGSLDLYAEEFDPRSGRHLGNFPQAFTHLALINAVSHVIADERRDGEGETTAVFSEMGGVREEA